MRPGILWIASWQVVFLVSPQPVEPLTGGRRLRVSDSDGGFASSSELSQDGPGDQVGRDFHFGRPIKVGKSGQLDLAAGILRAAEGRLEEGERLVGGDVAEGTTRA